MLGHMKMKIQICMLVRQNQNIPKIESIQYDLDNVSCFVTY